MDTIIKDLHEARRALFAESGENMEIFFAQLKAREAKAFQEQQQCLVESVRLPKPPISKT